MRNILDALVGMGMDMLDDLDHIVIGLLGGLLDIDPICEL